MNWNQLANRLLCSISSVSVGHTFIFFKNRFEFVYLDYKSTNKNNIHKVRELVKALESIKYCQNHIHIELDIRVYVPYRFNFLHTCIHIIQKHDHAHIIRIPIYNTWISHQSSRLLTLHSYIHWNLQMLKCVMHIWNQHLLLNANVMCRYPCHKRKLHLNILSTNQISYYNGRRMSIRSYKWNLIFIINYHFEYIRYHLLLWNVSSTKSFQISLV